MHATIHVNERTCMKKRTKNMVHAAWYVHAHADGLWIPASTYRRTRFFGENDDRERSEGAHMHVHNRQITRLVMCMAGSAASAVPKYLQMRQCSKVAT